MKRVSTLISLLLVLSVTPALLAAGGAPKVTKAQLTPQQKAAQAYNMGLGHRDKAWKYEGKLEHETDAKKIAKYEAKIQKEFVKAIDDFEDAIKLDPNLFQAYSSLGYALRRTGDYPRSLEAYDTALKLAPGYAEAIEYRAEAYLGLDRTEEAKRAYLILLNGGSDRAGELLGAMREYVDRKNESGTNVASFAEWVEKRESLVKMSGATASSGSW